MNFADLHELLRLELLRRIEAGELTGTRLAQSTGFQQAHISNFLNRRRSLSLEGLNRVLEAQRLTIDQLLPLTLAAAGTSVPSTSPDAADPIELVPVVTPTTAMKEARITASSSVEYLHLAAGRLAGGLSRPAPERSTWQRFVALRVDAQQAAAMAPLLPRGTLIVLDRHYTSLAPFRPSQPNLYAVRNATALLIRYVDVEDTRLILRPLALEHPIQLIELDAPPDRHLPYHLIGRVCLQLSEL